MVPVIDAPGLSEAGAAADGAGAAGIAGAAAGIAGGAAAGALGAAPGSSGGTPDGLLASSFLLQPPAPATARNATRAIAVSLSRAHASIDIRRS
jgi:hypothetical protein